MSFLLSPFGPGLRRCLDEKSRRYFRFLRARWRPTRVEGFSTIAERIRRAGRMRRAHKPATRRSEVRRLGDRCRKRLRIRSCCLTRTDSATTERMPPGPASRARGTIKCTKRMTRSRILAFYQILKMADNWPVLAIRQRQVPDYLRSDNGSEFTARLVRNWLERVGVKTLFIEPGSPWENGYVESLNGKFRDEFLNREIFYTLREAKVLIEGWRREYNKVRPHSTLGYWPPAPETILPLPPGSAPLHPAATAYGQT